MKKYILLAMATLSASAFAQTITSNNSSNPNGVSYITIKDGTNGGTSNYISPMPGVTIQTDKAVAEAAANIEAAVKGPNNNNATSTSSVVGQGSVNDNDPQKMISKEMEQYKAAQAKSQQQQQDLANMENSLKNSAGSNLTGSLQSKKVGQVNTSLPPVITNDIAGWNNSSIEQYTKQGKEKAEAEYIKFLNTRK